MLKILYKIVIAIGILFFVVTILSLLGIPKGFRIFTVMSGSMSPAISQGSIIFVIPQNEYRTDDVITFEKTDNTALTVPVTHRIISIVYDDINQPIYTTKGDANEAQDMEPVYRHQIIGKVPLSIPLLGYPVSFAKTKLGVILIVLMPAIVFSLLELRRVLNNLSKEKLNNYSQKFYAILLPLISMLLISSITYCCFNDTSKVLSSSFTTGSWESLRVYFPQNNYSESLLPTGPTTEVIEPELVIIPATNIKTDNT